MRNLKFSVLMPIHINSKAEQLKRAIESIMNQRIMPEEVIIIKDGIISDDLSDIISDYVKSYPNLFKDIHFIKRIGLGRALNVGVEKCKYDLIARMDGDDLCHKDRFKEQIEYLNKNRNIDILGTWIGEFELDEDDIISIRKVPSNHTNIYKYAKFRNPFNHMTVMLNKNAVLRAGNYQKCNHFEDYYLWVRMLKSGAMGANIPSILVYVRIGKELIDRRRGIEYFKSEIRFQKKIYFNGFLSYTELIRNLICRAPIRLANRMVLKILYKEIARTKFERKRFR